MGLRPTECDGSAANRGVLPRCAKGDVRCFKFAEPLLGWRAAPPLRLVLSATDVFRFHAAILGRHRRLGYHGDCRGISLRCAPHSILVGQEDLLFVGYEPLEPTVVRITGLNYPRPSTLLDRNFLLLGARVQSVVGGCQYDGALGATGCEHTRRLSTAPLRRG